MGTWKPPILSGATGFYGARPPLESLAAHFACTWSNTLPEDGRAIAVVADGSIDLEWIDGQLRIAGPDQEVKCESFAPGASVIGFRFRPGAASAWLGMPAPEIRGARVPLDVFWGLDADRIAEWVGSAKTHAEVVRRLEAALAGYAESMAAPDRAAAFIHSSLQAAPRAADAIDRLGAELAMSARTLRRRCNEVFGYAPKTLLRMFRFQRFVHLASRTALSMAELATMAGYADQPHLTREARRLAGMTPTAIRRQLAP